MLGRWALALFLIASASCRRSIDPELERRAQKPGPDGEAAEAALIERLAAAGRNREAGDRAAHLLLRGSDPIAASTAIRHLAARGCDGLLRALDGIDEKRAPFRLIEGLVDEVLAARDAACSDLEARLANRPGVASALTQARLRADRPAEALAALERMPAGAPRDFARGSILLRLGRSAEAAQAFERALALEDDVRMRVTLARLRGRLGEPDRALSLLTGDAAEVARARVAVLVGAGRLAEAIAQIQSAPLDRRLALAREAVFASDHPERLAAAGNAPPELLEVAAAAISERHGRVAALPLLRRLCAVRPDDAAAQEALAEALAESGEIDAAIAGWNRAATLAPGVDRLRLAPIRALAKAGRVAQARARADGLAKTASDADSFSLASAGYVALGVSDRALKLARQALAARPGDGRLVFLLAKRLDESGQSGEALTTLENLLRCGAHGRPWHRHEVSAALVDLARRTHQTEQALAHLRAAGTSCQTAEPGDLESYQGGIARELGRAE